MKRSTSQRTPAILLSCGAVLLWMAVVPAGALGQGGDYVNDRETCLECHDGMAGAFSHNVHARLSDYQVPGPGRDCEACHGPGSDHADSGEPEDIFLPSADLGAEAADVCLSCHTSGVTMNWDMGGHAMAELACQSCHDSHGNEAAPAMLGKSTDELCFSCHQGMKASFQLPSHHPLREGFMSCASCHDPHSGDFAGAFAGEDSREMCLGCHAQHAGPFIFEHSPVEEDCSICHDVHGTVANNLLRQNEPFLCLQCHQPHFHSGLTGIDGDYSVPGAVSDVDDDYAGLSGTSSHDAFKRVMMTKCSQCHQAVHGTDLPSQSITGQGRALNR